MSTAQSHVYVDKSNTGFADGSSWDFAYPDVQPAIDDVLDPDNLTARTGHILVAEGLYQPTSASFPASSTDLRARAFVIAGDRPFLGLHGGFKGLGFSEDPQLPDGKFHKTILTGTAWTAWTVLAIDQSAGPVPGRIEIDGFAIKDGRSDGLGIGIPPLESSQGGGVFARLTDNTTGLVIENVRFSDNFARDDGGGLFLTSPNDNLDTSPDSAKVIVRNCRFKGNHASFGAGIWSGSGAVRLGNNRFIDNGSLSLAGPPPTLVSTQAGGAIFIGPETHVLASNCLMYGNEAIDGGAIFHLPLGGADSLDTYHLWRNCTITDNRSVQDQQNPGNGAGVTIDSGSTNGARWPFAGVRTVTFDNCIIWGNRGPDLVVRGGPLAGQSILQGGVMASINNSNVGILLDGTDMIPGEGQAILFQTLSVDPLFVNSAASNYKLSFDLLFPSKSSPCIDAGVDAARSLDFSDIDEDVNFAELLEFDLVGEPRLIQTGTLAAPPWGEIVDMGAFECTKGIIQVQ